MTPEAPLTEGVEPHEGESAGDGSQSSVDPAMEFWKDRLPKDAPGGDVVHLCNPLLAWCLEPKSREESP